MCHFEQIGEWKKQRKRFNMKDKVRKHISSSNKNCSVTRGRREKTISKGSLKKVVCTYKFVVEDRLHSFIYS